MDQVPPGTDQQFVHELNEAVQHYLLAVDAWEAAYQKYYRLPGYADRVSDDLQEEHQTYLECRRRLEKLAPRARGLCFKHGLRDPFPGLLKATLGQHAPQQRRISAIGRSERSAVTECLMQLTVACREWSQEGESSPAEPTRAAESSAGPSWLRRMVDFLY